MSAVKPLFFDRVAGAFTAATLAFLPGFVLLSATGGFSGHVHPLSWLDQVSGTVGLILAIILAAIFLIAYPIERWLVKPNQSVWRIGGIYVAFIFILGTLIFAGFMVSGVGLWAVVLIYATPIAAITAFAGRVVYFQTSKYLKTNRAIATFLILLIALPLVLPDFSRMSFQASEFYPDVQSGEISRGTWDVNEADGSAGSHSSNTGLQTSANAKYKILWDCATKDNQKYRIYVQELDYKFSEEIDVVCSVNHEITVSVGTDIANERVKVMIAPVDGNEQTTDSDAYAILLPAT